MKQVIKKLIKLFFIVSMAPIAYPTKWFNNPKNDQLFLFMSQFLSLIPGILGVYSRAAFYRVIFKCPLENTYIGFGTLFSSSEIKIGNGVYIGNNCDIGLSTVEDNVLIGSGVHLISGKKVHYFDRTDIPIREQGGTLVNIIIGQGSWLGNNCNVLANIGRDSIVGAGSTVLNDTTDYSINAGNPAKEIRNRKDSV